MGLQQLGDRLVRFVGGKTGMWRVLAIRLVQGDGLPQAGRAAVCRGDEPSPFEPQWTLSGVISNIRYVERPEQQELTLKQAPLGRSEATLAALIPIRKTAAWWNLTQDERRHIAPDLVLADGASLPYDPDPDLAARRPLIEDYLLHDEPENLLPLDRRDAQPKLWRYRIGRFA
jgi:hypothetical protein